MEARTMNTSARHEGYYEVQVWRRSEDKDFGTLERFTFHSAEEADLFMTTLTGDPDVSEISGSWKR